MVAVKGEMQQGGVAKLIDDINGVGRELRSAFPQVRWIFFEPEMKD